MIDHPAFWGNSSWWGFPAPGWMGWPGSWCVTSGWGCHPLCPQYREPGASLGVDPGPAAGGPGGHRAGPAPGGGPGRGRVQRLKAPFTLIPAARDLGATSTPAEVESLARQVARELALVASTSTWPRSWTWPGRRPAPSGTALTARTQRPRPATPWRHPGLYGRRDHPGGQTFPGLGDTVVDSHEILPLAQSGDPSGRWTCCPSGRQWPRGCPWS